MTTLLSFLALLAFQDVTPIKALIMMDHPSQHFYQLEMTFPPAEGATRELSMAVWTPGSYKVRDFARNVEGFGAFDTDDKPLSWTKSDKSTWVIEVPSGTAFKVRYEVFAYEFSVRTSYLDDQHGFVNPASVFLYETVAKDKPFEIQVVPAQGWSAASALPKIGTFRFRAENYDTLVDSPFQFGRFRRHEFAVRNVPHYWLIAGDVNMNETQMVESLKKISETVADLFGSFPFENYYIFSQFRLDGAGGGLEHHNSTMVQGHSNVFRGSKGWNRFLGLIFHEYFHAWNVKAIRDEPLGPFDYQKENYTRLLWLHEGWTSYYDTLLMARAGFFDDKQLLKAFAKEITRYNNKPGTSRQSLVEASFNSWIHQYQPSETSANSRVNYYSEGAISGLALDLLIRNATSGEKSLDDVMRMLYTDYASAGKPISWDIVVETVSAVAGTVGRDFINTYVAAANPIPMEMFLEYAGLKMTWEEDLSATEKKDLKGPYAANPKVSLGVTFNKKDGVVFIDHVIRDHTGWQQGLDFGDEVLAINARRVDAENLEQILGWSRPGDEVNVLVSRAGRVLKIPVKLEERPKVLKLELAENAGTLEKEIYAAMFQPLGPPEDEDKGEEDKEKE